MGSFFKKALGVFLEFEEEEGKSSAPAIRPHQVNLPDSAKSTLDRADLDKFEKHFEKLFDSANLPGPDYFEFMKMMETLEAHIPDEKARMSAVYASLSIQGLTKDKLLNSARHYTMMIDKDKAQFEQSVDKKAKSELDSRKNMIKELEQKIVANSELIQKLTKEITEAQGKIATMRGEIENEEKKLQSNKGGYDLACEAMLTQINTDIKKIENIF